MAPQLEIHVLPNDPNLVSSTNIGGGSQLNSMHMACTHTHTHKHMEESKWKNQLCFPILHITNDHNTNDCSQIFHCDVSIVYEMCYST